MKTADILPILIHENQRFTKGRYIGENIRLIEYIINRLIKEKKLDFEKAFDSVEWAYILKVLERFNFGDSFRRWVKI